MATMKELNEALMQFIRPATFPLAIKMMESEEGLPERTRRPKKDMGLVMPLCQAVGMARKYGWTLALGNEDQLCPMGALTLGYEPPKETWLDGTFAEGPTTQEKEARAKSAQALRRFDYGKYKMVLMAPINRAAFDPDLVVMYANSAQVMRMVQASTFESGGHLTSTASGGVDCSEIITQTMQTDQCQFILPCNGDRVFGMTQDHEMAFTMPASKIDTTIRGLKLTYDMGQRYPVPTYVRFQAEFPEGYTKLMEHLRE
jgi:uncharacterized protein (DUF169 family)